jgi:hypothetical protein
MADLIVGIDLGQKRDYTALVVLEREARETGEIEERHHTGSRISYGDGRPAVGGDWVEKIPVTVNHYAVRHIVRLPLGVTYPQQEAAIAELYHDQKRGGHEVALVVDYTGVGTAVVDALRAARLPVTAIFIHGGNTVSGQSRNYNVPKGALASLVLHLLETERLGISSSLPEARLLTGELHGFKYDFSKSGHLSFGNDVGPAAWREQEHDDLVLAAALGCWYGENAPPDVEPKRYGSRIRSGSTF